MSREKRPRDHGSLPGYLAEETCDAVIIVPPLAASERPALGPHVLQACAREAGFRLRVLYANLWFAGAFGLAAHEYLAESSELRSRLLVGERLFARAAYGEAASSPWAGLRAAVAEAASKGFRIEELDPEAISRLREIERGIPEFVRAVSDQVVALAPRVVGCSSTFEQVSSSVAFLRRVKEEGAEIVTVIGGANCEGEMAEGMLSLDPHGLAVDVVVSGDGEHALVELLGEVARGCRPRSRLVRGAPCTDLDALPTPSFDDYFEQLGHFLPASGACYDVDGSALRDQSRLLVGREESLYVLWPQRRRNGHAAQVGDARADRPSRAFEPLPEPGGGDDRQHHA